MDSLSLLVVEAVLPIAVAEPSREFAMPNTKE